MRYIYVSKPGGKPLNIGINNAKRIARSADKRDQLIVLTKLGPGLPREHGHHQELVRSRHRYYHEQHEELVRDFALGPSDLLPLNVEGQFYE